MELEKMEQTVREIESLRRDLGESRPSLRNQAAAANFLGSVYMGVENVLKRIVKFRGQNLPSGEEWHV